VKQPHWIDVRDVRTLHEKLIATHGGAAGIRDEGLLASALARPRQQFAYADPADLIAMAAAYTCGIVRNHPFIDGNRRVGFVIGILFLEINGYRFGAPQEEAAQAVIALAEGSLDESAYARFLQQNLAPLAQS